MIFTKACGYWRRGTLQTDSGRLAANAKRAGALVIQFDELYQTNLTRVFHYVRYRVLNTATAEDVTADIFTSAFESLNGYNSDRGKISTWLFAIARRRVADYFRRSQQSVASVPLEMAASVSADVDIEQIGAQAMDVVWIVRTMEQLGEREREVIALRIGAGLSSKEISGQVGLKPGNVDVILHRSLKKLRTMLVEGDGSRG